MTCQTYALAEPFLQVAGSYLGANEAANSLMYGLALQAARSPERFAIPPVFAAMLDGDDLQAAAMMTPPNNLIITAPEGRATAEVMGQLACTIRDLEWPLPGVVGPGEAAKAFALAWSGLTKEIWRLRIHERLYELRKVIPPPRPLGAMRFAIKADLELTASWLHAFHKEALPDDQITYEEHLEAARIKIEAGDYFLWVDGTAVALAGRSRPTPNGCSIGPVYTPPAERCKGYATALTAELSQMLLDSGKKFTALFTDLANPTSNSIYMKIGYKPVCDFDLYEFIHP